jgi:parvulin-like peptidyl-prolyl isomerase
MELTYNTLIMKKMRAFPEAPALAAGILVLGLAAVLPACRGSEPSAGANSSGGLDEKTQARVILEISGASSTNADFDAYARAMVGESRTDLDAPALSRLFDEFCDAKILLSEARRTGVVLTDAERADYMAGFRRATGDEDDGPLPSAEAAVLADQILTEKYLAGRTRNISVDEAEIADYYEAHKSDFLQPEKVQVSQILLDSEGKASTIRDRLRGANEADFRAVARRESSGPEAVKGGIMGVFSPGQLPQELESFILPMREGEISRVVGSSYGFHIFRLDKRTEARLVPLADAAATIRTRLLDEKGRRAVAAHLEDLKRTLEWRAFPARLPFAYQRNDQP